MAEAAGREPNWHGRVWHIALPMILANVSTPLLGMVDTAIVGHLGDPALIGAVAVGALAFSLLYWTLGFLRMGTTALAAQALGREDRPALAAVLGRALLLAGLLALGILVLQWPLRELVLLLVEPSPQVAAGTRLYYDVRIWSAPATLGLYVVNGWLIGVQDSRSVLLLTLLLNGLNLLLSLVFVLGFGWGIAGVAAGTLGAEWLALVAGWLLVLRRRRRLAVPRVARAALREPAALWALVRINGDLFLRTLALQVAFIVFLRLGARSGDVTLAANAILQHLFAFLSYALDGFAFAAEALVGAAVGRRNRAAFVGAVEAATIWAAVFAIAGAIAYALAGPGIVGLFTDDPQVRAEAIRYLPWMVVMPLVAIWAFMLDGVFIGATRTALLRNSMLGSLLVFLAACWALTPGWGNHGLWCAFLLFMLARGLLLAIALPRLLRSLEATT